MSKWKRSFACSWNRVTAKRGPTGFWPLVGNWRNSRSEEHTSELQSRFDLVCRLLLEKKKQQKDNHEYPFLYHWQTCHQGQPNQATYQTRQTCPPASSLQEVIYKR